MGDPSFDADTLTVPLPQSVVDGLDDKLGLDEALWVVDGVLLALSVGAPDALAVISGVLLTENDGSRVTLGLPVSDCA